MKTFLIIVCPYPWSMQTLFLAPLSHCVLAVYMSSIICMFNGVKDTLCYVRWWCNVRSWCPLPPSPARIYLLIISRVIPCPFCSASPPRSVLWRLTWVLSKCPSSSRRRIKEKTEWMNLSHNCIIDLSKGHWQDLPLELRSAFRVMHEGYQAVNVVFRATIIPGLVLLIWLIGL